MLLQQKHIAVIGGGPAGLTLARLLQQKGLDVTVYERDNHRGVRQQGATLDLHENAGLKALSAAGLMVAFQKAYRPGADRMRLVDPQGRVLLDDHGQKPEAAFGDAHFRPEIDRGPLRDLLLDSLQPGTVAWDAQLTSATASGGGWELQFNNGRTACADLLIGADGVRSKIRQLVTSITPVFSGLTIIEGGVPATAAPRVAALLKGGKIFALGGSKSLILSAKGDGSINFYTGHKTEERWVEKSGINFGDRQQVFAWFKQEFAGWDSLWHELFAGDGAWFTPRPQYHMPVNQTWAPQPAVTLIGDAAHPMPPYAGEGVNAAMLDALKLSECLTDDGTTDLEEAITAYESAMRLRAAEAVQMSLEQTEMLHSPNGLANLLAMFREMEGQV